MPGPDVDVIAGIVLHRDAWKLHKQATHTLAFTTAAAVTAGFIIYEPGFEVVPTPADLPTLPQLGLRGPPQREK